MFSIRKGTEDDLEFIVKVDLKDEGAPSGNVYPPMSPEELEQHRRKMLAFLRPSQNTGGTEYDRSPKLTYLAVTTDTGKRIGLIMFLFRDMNSPTFQTFDIFDKFDRTVFPADGIFCEIFQLWVSSAHRRRGIATALKKKAEEIARKQEISMIYTHTAVENKHVVDMNLKLGYRVIRTGPLWDTYVRVSLVKDLR